MRCTRVRNVLIKGQKLQEAIETMNDDIHHGILILCMYVQEKTEKISNDMQLSVVSNCMQLGVVSKCMQLSVVSNCIQLGIVSN